MNRKVHFHTNLGDFTAELFEDKAPKTAGNFLELVEKGFHDGIIFHRVIDDFMIQGGDPTGTPWLDGHHAIFGKITEGMDVVHKIGSTPTDFADRPLEDVVMEKVEIVKE